MIKFFVISWKTQQIGHIWYAFWHGAAIILNNSFIYLLVKGVLQYTHRDQRTGWISGLPFHPVGPRDLTQIISLAGGASAYGAALPAWKHCLMFKYWKPNLLDQEKVWMMTLETSIQTRTKVLARASRTDKEKACRLGRKKLSYWCLYIPKPWLLQTNGANHKIEYS